MKAEKNQETIKEYTPEQKKQRQKAIIKGTAIIVGIGALITGTFFLTGLIKFQPKAPIAFSQVVNTESPTQTSIEVQWGFDNGGDIYGQGQQTPSVTVEHRESTTTTPENAWVTSQWARTDIDEGGQIFTELDTVVRIMIDSLTQNTLYDLQVNVIYDTSGLEFTTVLSDYYTLV